MATNPDDKQSITVNDREIECLPGDTYLDAFNRAGIEVPTLCHEPELKPSGACRICVVEIEGAPALVPACSTPVRLGSVVHTNSQRVRKARQTIVELILASHPLNCIVCDKQGNCTLQDLAYEYLPADRLGIFAGRMPETEMVESNEFFKLNYSACIRCWKCVRAAEEIQLCGVLSAEQRGFDAFPSPGFGRIFEEAGCVACGNCLAVCPVAALVPNSAEGAGREVDCFRVVTTCSYCGVGCQFDMVVNPKTNKVVFVDSHREAVVNGLALCVKGRFGWDFIHHEDRLNTPLAKQEDGWFKEITWEEAYDLIEKKFKGFRDTDGADSVALLTSAKCTNEENYLAQKLARACFGTNNVDHCARLCHASTVAGLARAFGSGAMTNSISDLTNDSDVVFVIGSNTTEAHPVIGIKLKQAIAAGKTKLIVADPRNIELTEIADVHLRQTPGTDVALISALMKVILAEDLQDTDFIDTRTEGLVACKAQLDEYELDWLCSIAGVSVDDVQAAARLYAKAGAAAIVYSMGITQHTTGTDNVLSLANLAMLTGNIGRPGTGVNPLRGQNNVQGACDLGGLPNVYPGYQKVDDPVNRGRFQKAWNVEHLSDQVGLTVIEIMNAAHKGDIKGLYIMGENPALSDPNVGHVREALTNVEFLVVQDIFLTETAQYADLVLPGTSFAEKEGTFTNTERRVQRVRRGVIPEGKRRPDWLILQQLLNRFGIPTMYPGPAEIMDEISEVTPIYGGISYERISDVGLQWPCRSFADNGTAILHKNEFARGKGKFHAVKFLDAAELPDAEYPVLLTTGRSLYHWHTGEMSRRSAGLNERVPFERSEINPVDAAALGIKDGDRMLISSRRGSVETTAQVTDRVQEGVVFMTFHFKESAANILTNDALDPIAKIPEFKVCAIKVAKA